MFLLHSLKVKRISTSLRTGVAPQSLGSGRTCIFLSTPMWVSTETQSPSAAKSETTSIYKQNLMITFSRNDPKNISCFNGRNPKRPGLHDGLRRLVSWMCLFVKSVSVLLCGFHTSKLPQTRSHVHVFSGDVEMKLVCLLSWSGYNSDSRLERRVCVCVCVCVCALLT